jgi:hypothetical protein
METRTAIRAGFVLLAIAGLVRGATVLASL